MITRAERMLPGAFTAAQLAGEAWRLSTGTEGEAEIYLAGVERAGSAVLRGARPGAVTLAWSAAGVSVTLGAPGSSLRLRARAATIHEPLPLLYRQLPLVTLDDAARRFWRRTFLIARMPGGRRVLRWIAQRRR